MAVFILSHNEVLTTFIYSSAHSGIKQLASVWHIASFWRQIRLDFSWESSAEISHLINLLKELTIFSKCMGSDSFTILGLWVLGLATSNINESPLQTNESKTLFLMTSLPYFCIPGLAGTRWNKNLCAKDAGCAGNKITAWVKVFRIIPEFKILRLTFQRKAASKCWIWANWYVFS